MSETEKEFLYHANIIKNNNLKFEEDDMKILYGLYKQSTIGDCNIQEPNVVLDYIGNRKWQAWNKCKNMEKEKAMKLYILKTKKLLNN